MRKILLLPTTLAIAIAPLASFTGCNKKDKTDEVYETLVKLEGVIKVERIHVDFTDRKVYDLWFEQPISWRDPSLGTFNQRVRFSFAGYDAVNEMFVRGYQLQDLVPNRYNDLETASHFNGNTLRPEYRFFGDSCPSDISDYTKDYWDYLTAENAAKDFHHIMTSFKEVFTGKWIMAGSSKGGFTVNAQAMLEKDFDVYVSYVAPRANDRAETAMYNLTFRSHTERAPISQDYDKNLAQFLGYGIVNKANILQKYFIPDVQNLIEVSHADFTSYFMDNLEKAYETCVGEAGVTFWQYEEDLKQLKDFNDLPEGEQKEKRFYEILSDLSSPSGFDVTNRNGYAYYIQAYKQMGEHKIAFNYLINYVNTLSNKYTISRSNFDTKESDEQGLWFNLCLLQDHLEAWTYDSVFQANLNSWYKNTTQTGIFMIYGSCDPWTSMSLTNLTQDGSETIHEYIGNDAINPYARSHRARIVELNKSESDQIWGLIQQELEK
ncbi:MAG: hypothetical protein ACOQNV_01025 [Mycoplasmoidaceae bacterium]